MVPLFVAAMWRRSGAVAVGAALGSRAALTLDAGGAAVALAGAQALAVGCTLWAVLPRRLHGLGPAAAALLLLALGLGARRSAAAGLLAVAGVSHAMLHAGLLALFGATLRRGQVPLATGLARRLNPAFHLGMEGYTRGVTAAWCAFFAGQLAGSAVLLAVAPGWWGWWTGLPGALLVLAMAAGERTVRGLRFPGMAHVPVSTVIRGVRAMMAARAAAAGAAGPATGCPGHSGSATPRPAPGRDSGPGPAA